MIIMIVYSHPPTSHFVPQIHNYYKPPILLPSVYKLYHHTTITHSLIHVRTHACTHSIP